MYVYFCPLQKLFSLTLTISGNFVLKVSFNVSIEHKVNFSRISKFFSIKV